MSERAYSSKVSAINRGKFKRSVQIAREIALRKIKKGHQREMCKGFVRSNRCSKSFKKQSHNHSNNIQYRSTKQKDLYHTRTGLKLQDDSRLSNGTRPGLKPLPFAKDRSGQAAVKKGRMWATTVGVEEPGVGKSYQKWWVCEGGVGGVFCLTHRKLRWRQPWWWG